MVGGIGYFRRAADACGSVQSRIRPLCQGETQGQLQCIQTARKNELPADAGGVCRHTAGLRRYHRLLRLKPHQAVDMESLPE